MAFSVLKHIRNIIKKSDSSANSLSKAAADIGQLKAEAKAAEEAGDMVRAASLLDKTIKIANDAEEATKTARNYLKGTGKDGARLNQMIPKKFKESDDMIRKWKESVIKFTESPKGEQLIKNVEDSKTLDRGIIKSTHKTINPFNPGSSSTSI